VGLPRDLYRCVLALALGLVLVMAAVVFLPYVIAGSTVGWRDGRLLLGLAAVIYAVPVIIWLDHRFGAALKLKPTRRQSIEITVVVMIAIAALVGTSMAVIPGASS
jgi:uncharacterized membrane protein